MPDFSKEIRTPKKNLLIGILSKENNNIYLIVKTRGKTERIPLEILLSILSDKKDSTRKLH